MRVRFGPFVKAVGGNKAASTLEGFAPRWPFQKRRSASDDGGQVFELFGIVSEERDQAPTHQDKLALSGVAMAADDRLVGCRRNVVVPRGQNKSIRQLAEVKVGTTERAYEIAAIWPAAPGPGGLPLNMPIEVRQAMSVGTSELP